MNDEFELITDVEAKEIRSNASNNGNRPLSPVTKALLAGETVFLVGRTSFNTKTVDKMNKRLHTHRGERGGRAGVYLWLEDRT